MASRNVLLLVVLVVVAMVDRAANAVTYHPAHDSHTSHAVPRGHSVPHGARPPRGDPRPMGHHRVHQERPTAPHDKAVDSHIRHQAAAHPRIHEHRRNLAKREEERLLAEGEDGDEGGEENEIWDDGCKSVVDEAIHGRLRGVHDAVECGSDVDEETASGDTALHIAAMSGNLPMMKRLLKEGATIDKRNKQGATAFHRAAAMGKERAARFLLHHGADVEALDAHGISALKHAEMSHHHDTAQHLRKVIRKLKETKREDMAQREAEL
eukprot:g640.t1